MKHYNPERRDWKGRSYKKGGTPVRTLREKAAESSERPQMKEPTYEHVKYLRIIAVSAERAKAFVRRSDEPVDLGEAPRHPGSRIWGFLMVARTHVETAH